MGKMINSRSWTAHRYGPVALAIASAVVCTFINPVEHADDWNSIQSIATGLTFGIALATGEALWGRRRWLLVALVPVTTLVGWIAAWWTTLYVGSFVSDLAGGAFGSGSNEFVSQVMGGVAGGAVGAALTAPSLSAFRSWSRLARATGIGAVLGSVLLVELQFSWQVLYLIWQAGFAMYLGRCLAADWKIQTPA